VVLLGSGYQTTGEAWLAASAAARAREERRVAREELQTTTMAEAIDRRYRALVLVVAYANCGGGSWSA
jgi:hypothetical protein